MRQVNPGDVSLFVNLVAHKLSYNFLLEFAVTIEANASFGMLR